MSARDADLRNTEPAHTGYVMKVNPIDCKAHGMCAELLPERITLDDWGYPILDGRELPLDLLDLARRAADACPTLALHLERQRRASH